MMTRALMAMTIGLAGLLLSACAPQQFRPGVVHDRIGEEMKQAAAERASRENAEKALMPPLAVEMPRIAEVEPRFDLSVVDAPARQVFMAIVTGTRYNMLVNPEVAGTITLSLKDVTVREALDAIRELYGYEYTMRGNRIAIQSNALQTRVFQINYLASRRVGASELRVTSSSIAGSGAGSTPMLGQPGTTPAQGSGVTGQARRGDGLDQSRADHHPQRLLGRSDHRADRDHRRCRRAQGGRQSAVGHHRHQRHGARDPPGRGVLAGDADRG